MFKSQLSGKVYGPGISPVRIVTEMRPKTYENYDGRDVIRTEGWEIVKEITVGPDEVENVKTAERK